MMHCMNPGHWQLFVNMSTLPTAQLNVSLLSQGGCSCSTLHCSTCCLLGCSLTKTLLCDQAYGRELAEAYEWCQKYRASRKEAELHQAWDLYYHVFKRINKQLPSLTVLELQYVAPALVRAQARIPGIQTIRTLNPKKRSCPRSPCWSCRMLRPQLCLRPGSASQRRSFKLAVHAQLPVLVCACLMITNIGNARTRMCCLIRHCTHLMLMFCGNACLVDFLHSSRN